MKKKLLALIFMVCFLTFTVGAASAIDFHFGDAAGSPYCDGINLNFNLGTYTTSGNLTGCLSGAVGGGIGLVTAGGTPGIGAIYGYDSAIGVIIGTTEINLGARPPKWRHIGLDGIVNNEGILLIGTPPAVAEGGAGVSSLD